MCYTGRILEVSPQSGHFPNVPPVLPIEKFIENSCFEDAMQATRACTHIEGRSMTGVVYSYTLSTREGR